jgi:hypothetical protein
MINARRNGCRAPDQREAAMAAFGKKGNSEPVVIDFNAKWPLAFRVKMLTIPGLALSIPITRRQP